MAVTVGFPTDMTAPFSKNFEATNGVMPKELVPQERMGNEDELAGSIIYLASKVRALYSYLTWNSSTDFIFVYSGRRLLQWECDGAGWRVLA